jgi:hypothetical protein
MFCRKCKGRVFIDRSNTIYNMIELFCTMCGKRWFIKSNEGNSFVSWLLRSEKRYHQNYATSF